MSKTKDKEQPEKKKKPAEKKAKENKEESSMQALIQEELERTKKLLQEEKDQNLRQLAELENTRKRLQKEKQDLIKYSLSQLIADFLSPLDQMEKALDCAENQSDEVKNWAIGFKMILTQFKDVFSSHNVTEYSGLGSSFDPHLHEAMEVLETDEHPEGSILEEFAKGYKMGDLIVRPAKVKVAKACKPSEEPTGQEANKEESLQDNTTT